MKIAIIGTHFSGKTGLVDELFSRLKDSGANVAKIGEVARRCPLPVNTGTTLEAQKWILMQQIKDEIEASASAADGIVLSDRSVVDNYIYMLRGFPEQANSFLPLVLEHTMTYDFMFKTVPSEPVIAPDGFRDTDPVFREDIERMLSDFLAGHGIEFFELPCVCPADYIIRKISSRIQAGR